jgi:hypothetical protein
MALTVEDGTGVASADSYSSTADADAYNTNHAADTDWSGATTANKEKALRLATQYLDLKYKLRWRGEVYSTTQGLAWPRTAFDDYDGNAITSPSLPSGVQEACIELAIRSAKGDTFFPVTDDPGLLSHSWANETQQESRRYASGSVARDFKTYPVVEALLSGLVHSGPRILRS